MQKHAKHSRKSPTNSVMESFGSRAIGYPFGQPLRNVQKTKINFINRKDSWGRCKRKGNNGKGDKDRW